MTPLLQINGLTKRFGGFVALDSVTFDVMPGERVGLIGPNGSGKSTLVNCMSGALANEVGTVKFEGEILSGLAPNERTHLGIARSFQLPRPFRSLSVADNVRIPLLYRRNLTGHFALSKAETADACIDLLAQVDLQDKADWMPSALTQVELRKLELIRAVATKPKLLFADESMAGLSESEVADIVSLLLSMNSRGLTIIMIEHIMSAVMRFSERLIVLVSGKVIADGAPSAVIRDPLVESAYLGQ